MDGCLTCIYPYVSNGKGKEEKNRTEQLESGKNHTKLKKTSTHRDG